MKQLVVLTALTLITGCTVEERPAPVAVVEPAPVEYYVVGGRYYHWGPQERWVEVREAPRGVRVERAERLPERPVHIERNGHRVLEPRR